MDNSWIVKPISLTRSIDVSVTNLFDMIIRLPESGSKIACKYISNPVLLKIPTIAGTGVKFDVRYMLLVRSLRPLKLYVHKIFWLRFAKKSFVMKDFDDPEIHFTGSNGQQHGIDCQKFIQMFNEQHGRNWSMIERQIFQMFREVFHCATAEDAPLGIGLCSSSRALYAADLMLEMTEENEMQPKLLEMNMTIDGHRACADHPNFLNQIFNVLFRDLIDEQNILEISMDDI